MYYYSPPNQTMQAINMPETIRWWNTVYSTILRMSLSGFYQYSLEILNNESWTLVRVTKTFKLRRCFHIITTPFNGNLLTRLDIMLSSSQSDSWVYRVYCIPSSLSLLQIVTLETIRVLATCPQVYPCSRIISTYNINIQRVVTPCWQRRSPKTQSLGVTISNTPKPGMRNL